MEREREASGKEVEERFNDWAECLSRILLGINAATSRTAVGGTMVNNLAIQCGSRFNFSHDFIEVRIGQLEDKLEGKDSSFICGTCFELDGLS